MSLRGRLVRGALAFGIALSGIAPATISAGAASQTYTIGVDNAGPPGHNFEYLDFYPRSSLKVHQGDVVGFDFNTASLDGFHTATLGKLGESAAQVAANNPLFTPDADDGPNQLQFALTTVFLPSNPPPAAGGCGDAARPCPYNGTSEINSGALCSLVCPNTRYFFKIALPEAPASPLTVNFMCLIHGPFMSGSFTIVPDQKPASTMSQVVRAAATQFRGQTAAGLAAEQKANEAAESVSEDGVRTLTLTAGTESKDGRTQVLEMLPTSFRTDPAGEGALQIRWRTIGPNEIHTVTFPAGAGSNGVDPLPFLCEGTPADTPATGGPPFFGCAPPGQPGGLENHLVPQPQGATAITSPSTVGSSGIISAGPIGFPSSFTFSFPSPGTFSYQCRIHDHMRGTIQLAASDEGGGE